MKYSNNSVTLNQLISKTDFINWFLTIENSNIIYSLINQLSFDVLECVYATSSVPFIITMLSNSETNQYLTCLIPFLLAFIYDVFNDAIPYNQTLTNSIIYTAGNVGVNQQVPLNLLVNISGYINAYMNEIINWFLIIKKNYLALNIINSQATRKVTETENTDNLNQSQQLNKDSFNPVENSANVSINPIPVKTISNGGMVNNNYQDVTSATWNTSTTGNTANTNRSKTETELDLTQLRSIGNEQILSNLKPLFKKIGT
ncbi:MAG: hypothetical protein IIT97_00625, partial [Mycoplasmataceae bacterium]|nr:hypothetical protein [Mycoplasmataceae bacterium]